MAESSINPYVGELFKLANAVAPPLVQQLATNRTDNTRGVEQAFQQRLADTQLNGSGPNDAQLAAQSAPRGLLDQITGQPAKGVAPTTSGGMMFPLILAGLGLIVLVFLFKR